MISYKEGTVRDRRNLYLLVMIIGFQNGFFMTTAFAGWVWPTTSMIIKSDFGPRKLPLWEFHHGVDIHAPIGSPVYAAEAGTVQRIIGSPTMTIGVIHSNGLTSQCLHSSSLIAPNNSTVAAGDLIAYSGETGVPGQPHLHFQLRPTGTDGRFRHPFSFLPYANTAVPVFTFIGVDNFQTITPCFVDATVNTSEDKDLNQVSVYDGASLMNRVYYDNGNGFNNASKVNCLAPQINGVVGLDGFRLDLSRLSLGEHTLTFVATDAKGFSSALIQRTVTVIPGSCGSGGEKIDPMVME